VSISPTFYEQIPKAQKDTDDLTVFLALLESSRVKATRKMLVKLTEQDIQRTRRPTNRFANKVSPHLVLGNFWDALLQSVSWIWANFICLWWFDLRLEPIYNTAQAASKNNAEF